MLIENGDGTFTGGALDVLAILHDQERGTFHPAFFTEAPFPGPVQDFREVSVVRLKCRAHHTVGAPDLEGARVLFDEFAEKIQVPEENRWRDDEPLPWDGSLGLVTVVSNWRAGEAD